MKFLKPVLSFVALAGLAFALWHYLFPPPEKVIRGKLEALARTISETPQGNISRVTNVSRIGAFFHPNVSINLEGFGRDASSIQGRGELEQTAMGVRQNSFRIAVQFSNVHITVGPEENQASALVTAEVMLGDRTEPIVQDIRLSLERFDRSWLIRTAEPSKALKIE